MCVCAPYCMTYAIYIFIQRGLFERHKLTFALMLTNKILLSANSLSPELVSIFLKGGGSLDINSVRKKPKEWIPDKGWLDMVALSQHNTFSDLLESVYRNNGLLRQWYDREAPEVGHKLSVLFTTKILSLELQRRYKYSLLIAG